jgi:ATP-dependent RNA helicase RhlE
MSEPSSPEDAAGPAPDAALSSDGKPAAARRRRRGGGRRRAAGDGSYSPAATPDGGASGPSPAGPLPDDEAVGDAAAEAPPPTAPSRPAVDPVGFRPFGLSDELLEGIGAMGFVQPTPIQEQTIPLVLQGRDVVGTSQTGSGKTAAFVLPILHVMQPGEGVRALVVTPTRELARQIEEMAVPLAQRKGFSVLAVYGGVRIDAQIRRLQKGVDLLAATPGRLLDLKRRGNLDLSHVRVLVLDEADRMLDMGFWPDVRRIVQALPKERQNLLFSATMSRGVLAVIRDALDRPVYVEVGATHTPVETVEQVVLPVNQDQKTSLLVHYLTHHDPTRTLVFCRTKIRADRVTHALERQGVNVTAIHSDRDQAERQQALDGFRRGSVDVLVATDIVARGIDVEEISHVINYDVPESPDDYIHRIGRTARAGAEGTAVTLLSAEEGYLVKDIEQLIGAEIERRDLAGFAYEERSIPLSSELPRRPGKLVYRGGAQRAAKFGIRHVKPRSRRRAAG